MDFKSIIIRCCNNEQNWNDLIQYFYREWRKSEQEFWLIDSFFSNLIDALVSLNEKFTLEEFDFIHGKIKMCEYKVLEMNNNSDDKLISIKKQFGQYDKNHVPYNIFPNPKQKYIAPFLRQELKEIEKEANKEAKHDVNEKELHNNIFIGNAFEIFEKYHNNKLLAENCKTDLNLLFQLFQDDNLFVETIELKHYIKWLNKTYQYALTELKKVDKNSKPNRQRTKDYNEYKRTTLKQPLIRSK